MTANLSPALLETVVERASMISIQEKSIINTDLMFRAFERATLGLTDRATTAEKHKQRADQFSHGLYAGRLDHSSDNPADVSIRMTPSAVNSAVTSNSCFSRMTRLPSVS